MNCSNDEVKKELCRIVMYKGMLYVHIHKIERITNKGRIISTCPEALFQGMKTSRLGNFNQYSDGICKNSDLNFVTIVYKEHAEEAIKKFSKKYAKIVKLDKVGVFSEPKYGHISRAKYVIRINTQNTWWVRIVVKNKVVFSKFFADSVHGGKEAAYKKAVECRDKAVEELKIPYITAEETKRKYREVTSNRKIVIVGVYLTKKVTKYGTYFNWRAMTGGKDGMSFSVKLHGYENAFNKAVAYRCRSIQRPIPKNIKVPSPESLVEREELLILKNLISQEHRHYEHDTIRERLTATN